MNSGGQSTASGPGIRVLIEPAEQDVGSPNKNDDGIDIVAIHGIGADPDKTWTGRGPAGEQVSWLSDSGMLPKAVPTARIMRFGYESAWYGTKLDEPKKTHVFDVAEMLLKQLELHRQDITRPIIFIAHSYGGLVLMQALRRSFDNPDKWRHLFRFTAGAIFFGTPFRGRRGLTLVQIVEAVAQHNPDLQIYSETMALSVEENPYLQNIVYQFTETRRGDHPIPLWCFYETKPSPIGKTLLNSAIKDGYLIPAESACLDPSKSIERYPLERHHYNLQKFSGPSDPGYVVAEKAIVDLATRAHNYLRERCDHRLFSVPFAENHSFVGREGVIQSLINILFNNRKDRVALVGMGGVGKTQVALRIAYMVDNEDPRCSILWLPAFSMAGFEQACTDLVKILNLQSNREDDARELIQQHLSSGAVGRWLLILDNADSEDVLQGSKGVRGIYAYLPRNRNGQVLVTTRWRKIAVDFAKQNVISIAEMERKDAKCLLQTSLISEHFIWEDHIVNELLHLLTYLPLAIVQAAAYMNVFEVPVEEYLMLCRHSQQDMMELMRNRYQDDALYDESQGAVATTWLISFNQLQKHHPAATRLLFFIMWIEPQAIPQSMLPDVGSEQEKVKAIGTLKSYGFLRGRSERGIFDMHSLVHMVMQSWAEDQGIKTKTKADTLRHLAEVFQSDAWENRDVWRLHLPHVLHVFGAYQEIDPIIVSGLGYWAGRCLFQDGRIKEAVTLLEQVVEIEETSLAQDHPSRLASQHALAGAYEANGQIQKAVTLLEQVVKIRETTLAQDHPDRLASQHELAGAYEANGQIQKAVTLLEQVVKIQETTLAQDHPDRLASQHELARAYRANGQIQKAVTLLEQVVEIEETSLAQDHPSRLASQQELARAYRANGQIQKAVTLLEQVVKIRETTLAQDHPDRLASQHALAGAYKANGQIQKAVTLLEQVVKIQETTLTQDHPDRLASQHELAGAYEANGQIQKAVTVRCKL